MTCVGSRYTRLVLRRLVFLSCNILVELDYPKRGCVQVRTRQVSSSTSVAAYLVIFLRNENYNNINNNTKANKQSQYPRRHISEENSINVYLLKRNKTKQKTKEAWHLLRNTPSSKVRWLKKSAPPQRPRMRRAMGYECVVGTFNAVLVDSTSAR